MTDKPTTPHAPIPDNEGFLANRWRMIKAGAKSVLTYLTSPKTWVMAAAFAGAGLAINQFAPGIGLFSHMGEGLAGAAQYMAQMLVIGTGIHMAIDMYKEGHLKGMSPDTPGQSTSNQTSLDPTSAALEQSANLVSYADPQQTLPSPVTPPIPGNAALSPNNQPDRSV